MRLRIASLVLVFSLVLSVQATRQVEYLNRGLVAVKTAAGKTFVSWRQLGTEAKDITYKLYRGQALIFTSSGTLPTCFQDNASSDTASYRVSKVVNGIESDTCAPVKVQANCYQRFAIRRPAAGRTPTNQVYTYTPWDSSVADLDGDGEYEIVVLWQPSNAQDNSVSGYTGEVFVDAYKFDGTFMWRISLGRNIRAGSHYTQLMVYDLDGDGRAEVVMKTADGGYDALSNPIGDPKPDYRNGAGYILDGPEYLTVFEGLTGKALQTIPYRPGRGNVSDWGDSYGNRVDRFLACIAYLDGQRPSVVFCRGYYTRATLAAFDFRDGKLTERWFFDSDMPGNDAAYGQGNHQINVADVDNDGNDEILYGSAAIDHDGKLLYSTGLGHGDSFHTMDINPDRAGYEIFGVHEETGAAYGHELHDARTGEILWGSFMGYDVGRGISADIDSRYRGRECWGDDGVRTCTGTLFTSKSPVKNSRIYWDGDLQDELLDKTYVYKWNGSNTSTIFDFSAYSHAKYINGTKGTPNISADLFGDWREECVYFDSTDYAHMMVFTTIIPTGYRLFTLMHEPVYRLGVAWENVCYNQPPQLGPYIGSGVSGIAQPDIVMVKGTPGKPAAYASIRYVLSSSGGASQTIKLGETVKAFSFRCENATSLSVSGLPPGMKWKYTGDTLLTMGSVPTAAGVYPYTLTTTGATTGLTNLSMIGGTITVVDPTALNVVGGISGLAITPNPMVEASELKFESNQPAEARLSLFDLRGQRCRESRLELNAGFNSVRIEKGDLPAGVYLLQVRTSGTTLQSKLVVR